MTTYVALHCVQRIGFARICREAISFAGTCTEAGSFRINVQSAGNLLPAELVFFGTGASMARLARELESAARQAAEEYEALAAPLCSMCDTPLRAELSRARGMCELCHAYEIGEQERDAEAVATDEEED